MTGPDALCTVEIITDTSGKLTLPTGEVIDVELEACTTRTDEMQNCDASYF